MDGELCGDMAREKKELIDSGDGLEKRKNVSDIKEYERLEDSSARSWNHLLLCPVVSALISRCSYV